MKKILVLEDEPSIRSFVVINLRRSGYEPIEAATGEQALEKLKQNPDTLVALLDVMLPDIDGLRGLPPHPRDRLEDGHPHAQRQEPGDGQDHRSHDRRGRLCHQALLPG